MPSNLVNLTPEVIAKWPPSNFTDPYRRTWVTPVLALMYGVASVAVALRLWVRFRKHGGGLGYDDVLLSIAWVLSTGFTICSILSVELTKSDRHMWDVPEELWVKMAMLTGIAEVLYLSAGGFIRVSVLLFYRRLVDEACSKRWRYAIIGAIIFTICWVIAMNVALIFSCAPVDAYWKSFDPGYAKHYRCVDIAAINYIVGTLTIVADLYSIALPCIMTWNFTMPRSQKIGLNIIFGLGLSVVAVCATRNYYLFRLSKDSDFSWLLTDVYVLCQLEVQLAFVCASAPALRIVFRQYLKHPMAKLLGSSVSDESRDTDVLDSSVDQELWGDFYSALAGRWSVSGPGTGQQPTPFPMEKANVKEQQAACSFDKMELDFGILDQEHTHPGRTPQGKCGRSDSHLEDSPV